MKIEGRSLPKLPSGKMTAAERFQVVVLVQVDFE